MEVTQALASRRTVRTFLAKPVPRGIVTAILEAALRAPSWANTQPWEIYVAGGEALERIRKAYIERTEQGTAARPDLPFPEKWPDACRERTRALTAGRYTPGFEDIRALAHPVLRHRILLNFHAESEGVTTGQLVDQLLETVPVPKSGM